MATPKHVHRGAPMYNFRHRHATTACAINSVHSYFLVVAKRFPSCLLVLSFTSGMSIRQEVLPHAQPVFIVFDLISIARDKEHTVWLSVVLDCWNGGLQRTVTTCDCAKGDSKIKRATATTRTCRDETWHNTTKPVSVAVLPGHLEHPPRTAPLAVFALFARRSRACLSGRRAVHDKPSR
jgi:hypothetical protein